MTDRQAYLEKWYSEMTSGAVQTFEQLVPETFGSGRIAQAVSDRGLLSQIYSFVQTKMCVCRA